MTKKGKIYRIAVVGDRASVLGFKALGVEVFTPEDAESCRKTIDTLAREGAGLIYLTERLAAQIPETVERFRSTMVPAIILIPDRAGSLGMGKAAIRSRVEKAVGKDILTDASSSSSTASEKEAKTY